MATARSVGRAVRQARAAVAPTPSRSGPQAVPEAATAGGGLRRRRGRSGGRGSYGWNRIGPKRRSLNSVLFRGLYARRFGLALAEGLARSDLSLSILAASLLTVSCLTASPFGSSSRRASILGGSSPPVLPRLLSLCLAADLRPSGPCSSVARGACPSAAGLVASGPSPVRATRLALRPWCPGSPGGGDASESGLARGSCIL